MHYFTVNSEDSRHLGFLVLMANDEATPQSGCCAVKAQAEVADQQHCPAQWRVLTELAEATLFWQRHGEELYLLDPQGCRIGRLQQQYLKLNGQHFVLTDLTGTL